MTIIYMRPSASDYAASVKDSIRVDIGYRDKKGILFHICFTFPYKITKICPPLFFDCAPYDYRHYLLKMYLVKKSAIVIGC